VDKKKILIVDDEPDVLSVLGKSLSVEGYSVITADNGNDAITLAKSEHPDLITLDILMPDIDGGKVAEKLREDPRSLAQDISTQTTKTILKWNHNN
jgi:CheY-like chemotaxis protein